MKRIQLITLTLLFLAHLFTSCTKQSAEENNEMETNTISEEQKDNLPGDPSLPTSTKELQELIAASKGDFKYSIEDFFKNPEKTRYQLSPDGNYFSFMGPYERRQNIFVQKIGEDKAVRITSETDRDISGYFWANDNRILFIKDSGGDENFKLYAVDKTGENAKDLTPFDGVRIQIIDDLEDIEDEIIIGMNKNNPQLFEPYRLNVESGQLDQIAENNNPVEPIDGWITDHNGKLRIATKVVGGTNTTIMYRATEDKPFKDVSHN